jgi:hypothetical protein
LWPLRPPTAVSPPVQPARRSRKALRSQAPHVLSKRRVHAKPAHDRPRKRSSLRSRREQCAPAAPEAPRTSVRDHLIPIGRARPTVALPTRGFLLGRLPFAGPVLKISNGTYCGPSLAGRDLGRLNWARKRTFSEGAESARRRAPDLCRADAMPCLHPLFATTPFAKGLTFAKWLNSPCRNVGTVLGRSLA